ncbi:MAG: hypothetical protein KY447_04350 [Actinobacteria bacterium]|nr:hypothetical protein [Actinomycetota bacterium]MBW3642126.1 hypothetical protein [Actinomycetota bacterium]
MFTLVVCLVVVAFSGAAVVHIVLSDALQRATLRTPPRRDRPTGPRIPSAEEAEPLEGHLDGAHSEPRAGEQRSPSAGGSEVLTFEAAEPGPAPPLGVAEASPQPSDERRDRSLGHQLCPDAGGVRSVALLGFLTAVTGLLAAAVAVVVALVAVALRATLP